MAVSGDNFVVVRPNAHKILLMLNTLVPSDEGKIMRLINKVAYCLAAVIPVAVLAGCSGGGASSGAASGPPPEVSSITIDAVPTADESGLYIAYDDGLFKQQGLTVKINTINGGEFGMPDLQDNKAQLVAGNYVSFILAQIAGKFGFPPGATVKPISMRIIADASQMQPGNQALYVLPNSRYKTVANLATDHATIGINSPNNIAQVLLGSLFAADGLHLSKIKQVVHPVFPTMPAYLAAHKIDAAWLPEPFGTEAEQEYGAVQLADLDQGAIADFPIGAIVGSQQWVQTHPNTVAAFLRAFQQGQQIADSDRAAVEQALVIHTGVSKVVAATMTLDTYPLAMDIPVMQRVPDAMFEFGVTPGLRKPYDIASMIQPEPGEIK
jgi:NitT/TauT family transport system substrate-binding protein